MVQIGGSSCWIPFFGAVLLVAGAGGCASQNPALEKQLAEVNQKLLTAENDNARLELRVAGLEARFEALSNRSSGGDGSRPPLKLIRLAPEGPPASERGGEAEPSGRAEEAVQGQTSDHVVADPSSESQTSGATPTGEGAEALPEQQPLVIRIDGDQILQAGGEDTKRAPLPAAGKRGKKTR